MMQERREIIAAVPAEKYEPERTELGKVFEPKLPAPAEPYAGFRNQAAPDERVPIAEYWRAIRKRLWLVAGIVVLAMTLAAIYMSRRPNIYQAKSRVQVDLEQVNPDLVTSERERRAPTVNGDPAYFNTQLQNLNSPTLLRRVVKQIDLENNKDFPVAKPGAQPGGFRGLLRLVGLGGGDETKVDKDVVPIVAASNSINGEELAEAKRMQPYVEVLQRDLIIEPVRESRSVYKDTRLIDISYQNTNPELAAQIVNTVAEVFSKSNEERRTGTSSKTNTYLKERTAELQSDVKRDEQQLVELRKKAEIVPFEKDRSLALSELELLARQLLDVQNQRKNAEAALRTASAPDALAALTQDSIARRYIDDTKFELAKRRQEREKLSVEFTDSAPEIQEVDRQIATLEKALNDYQKNSVNVFLQNLKTRFEAAKQQEDKVQAQYDKAYNAAQVQNVASVNIKLLEQRLEANKDLLTNLQKTQRDNDITAAGTDNNVSVVDAAIPPEVPVGPRRLMSVLIVGFLAGLFGCGLALFFEYLDDTVRTTEDVENHLRMPAIAMIPMIDGLPRRRFFLAGNSNNNDSTGLTKRRSEMLINNDTRSALAEAFRQLRTSVLLSTAGHPPRSILVTSSVPSEGKTTTAVNMAISLAQTGARVLIIDADMRRPRLHSLFKISNETGLSSILSSHMSDAEVVNMVQQDPVSKLYLLPSGAVPPNPAELIGSEQMRLLMRMLEKHFTHVVVDSPPIASFTDGVMISTMVDGVLLVVHSGKSSRQIIKRSKQLLTDVGAKVLGVVLNNVNYKLQENYYYYHSYYNSYYGGDE